MQIHVGTSGFAYPAWKGTFYPEAIGEKEMLGWYAGQFNAVEINSTFYRFPTHSGLAAWAAQVPEQFHFAIKAPHRITHTKRLHNVDDDVTYLLETVQTLGIRLGPLLFQLPPGLPLDMDGLKDLSAQLPPMFKIAFEFRHPSWFCEEVYQLLAKEGYALCFNDTSMPAPHATADWGYLHLRKEQYSEEDLTNSAESVLAQPWREAYAFVKHETPDSPLLARRWSEIISSHPRRSSQ